MRFNLNDKEFISAADTLVKLYDIAVLRIFQCQIMVCEVKKIKCPCCLHFFNSPAFVEGNLTKLLESSKQLEQTKMYESFYEKNFQSTFSIFQNSVYERKNT